MPLSSALSYTTKVNVGKGGRDGVAHKGTETVPCRLCSEDFLPFADFFLDSPADPFALAFGFRIGLVCHPSNFISEVAFDLVKPTIRFVLGAWPNGFSPLAPFDLRVARRNIGDVSLPLSATRS